MGRPADEEEIWEELDDSVLRELSPVLDVHKHGLFQRISRQRARYFADVEEVQKRQNSQSGVADSQCARGSAGWNGSQAKAQEGGQPPSAFADLSTWCCDALPARSRLHRMDAQPSAQMSTGESALADQPTIALSGLFTAPFFHVADVPTVPLPPPLKPGMPLSASSKAGARQARQPRQGALRRFWQSLRRMFATRLARRPRQPRAQASSRERGRALVLERLRERNQQGARPRALPQPPGGKRAPITPPPVDRLFG
jgi:hypothetical protein